MLTFKALPSTFVPSTYALSQQRFETLLKRYINAVKFIVQYVAEIIASEISKKRHSVNRKMSTLITAERSCTACYNERLPGMLSTVASQPDRCAR